MKSIFRTGYEAYDASVYATPMDSRSETQQHAKNDCDINQIVKRYRPDEIAAMRRPGQYDPDGVLLNMGDFQTQMERLANASSLFEELPSQVRKDFKNDPARLLEAIERKDELAYKHGFLEKASVPSPEPSKASPDHSGGDPKGA